MRNFDPALARRRSMKCIVLIKGSSSMYPMPQYIYLGLILPTVAEVLSMQNIVDEFE